MPLQHPAPSLNRPNCVTFSRIRWGIKALFLFQNMFQSFCINSLNHNIEKYIVFKM